LATAAGQRFLDREGEAGVGNPAAITNRNQERSEMATVDSVLETLLNEHDVARITGLSVASVRRWRLLRQGPKYIKIGAAVRYKPEDVAAWLESRPSGGGQQA
jgi:predicted DNA-binding transcriptional regulator AlpA